MPAATSTTIAVEARRGTRSVAEVFSHTLDGEPC